ncbi:N-acetyltransferase [Microbacterium sorbitolivorans]|uniref:N-acetyltransferase n=2 Tax=Microbacterium sorbitolivorans TaxID=1867410 RepID=A0A367Y313_9MICO|nr:N-acetyltransferase [Microbacterium sorbitolivorans]
MLDDDLLWAEIYLLPYLDRHPDLAFVAENDAGRAVGYIIGTDDTDAFDAWFARTWWPSRRATYSGSANPRQRELVAVADARRAGSAFANVYPAHLHIDLLPETQGKGMGRMLIARLADALAARGVRGLHAVASSDNAGAVAFYPRLGFVELDADPGARAFGLDLTH